LPVPKKHSQKGDGKTAGRKRRESLDNGLQDEKTVKIPIPENSTKIKHRGMIRRAWGQFKQANALINSWRYYNRV